MRPQIGATRQPSLQPADFNISIDCSRAKAHFNSVMFFSNAMLVKKGALAKIWFVSTFFHRLNLTLRLLVRLMCCSQWYQQVGGPFH